MPQVPRLHGAAIEFLHYLSICKIVQEEGVEPIVLGYEPCSTVKLLPQYLSFQAV